MKSPFSGKMDLHQVFEHYRNRPVLISLIVLASVFTNFVIAFDVNLYFFSSPFILQAMAAPDIYLGLTASSFTLGVIIFAYAGGLLFSRYSIKYALILSIAVITISSVLTGYVSNALELVLARFMLGAGNGILQGVITGFLGGIYPARKGFLLSLKGISFSAGMLFGPYTESLFIPGFKMAFMVTGYIGLASILLLFFFLPDVSVHAGHDGSYRLRRLFNRNTTLSFIAIFLFGIGLFGFLGYFSHYMISYLGLPSGTAAVVSSMLGVGGLIMTVPLGHLSDIWNKRGTLLLIFALLSVSTLEIFLGNPGVIGLMAMGFIFGGAYNGMINVISAATQHYAHRSDIGPVSGMTFSFYSGGGIIGGVFFGSILHIVGFRMAGFISVTAVMILGLIFTLMISESRRPGSGDSNTSSGEPSA